MYLHKAKHKAIEKILNKHQPVLILTHYKAEMRAILDAFPQAEKFDEKRMDEWKAGKIPVWVSNFKSISHGINGIQKSCSTIVWASLTYSLESYQQTNARILRTGQNNQAKIYRILAENTVDFIIANSLERKHQGQSSLMEAVKMLQRANPSEPATSAPAHTSPRPLDFLL